MDLISKVKVYGLEDSIEASKYPMSVDLENDEYVISCLKKYGNILEIFNKISTLENLKMYDDYFSFKKDEKEILISYEDYEIVLDNITFSDGYAKSNNIHIHKLILNEEGKYTDHINKNRLDNRRYNLRLCEPKENNYNASLSINNTSGVIGVSYRKDRRKWRAYISPNNKQITLGLFENFEDAVKSRLFAELEYFGEFSPQIELMFNYKILERENETKKISALVAKSYLERIKSLGNSNSGSGHDNALKGIIVQFNLSFTNKAWVEAERYHFFDIVSSQSTMHKINRLNLNESYNQYVDKRMIDIMKEKVYEYNDMLEHGFKSSEELMKERYLEILYSNPSGFQLTAKMTTNYQQLKTIYYQRKDHKLPEWKEFCKWVETLPMFKELCLMKGDK